MLRIGSVRVTSYVTDERYTQYVRQYASTYIVRYELLTDNTMSIHGA